MLWKDLKNVKKWIKLKTTVTEDNYKQYQYYNSDNINAASYKSLREHTDAELMARFFHVRDIYKGMKSSYAKFAFEGQLKSINFEQDERILKRIYESEKVKVNK